MKDSKVIVIDKYGNINLQGRLDDFRHSIVLLNYIKEKYPTWHILNTLDYTVSPLILGTILIYAKNIVFLNTTKKHILSGILLIGHSLTDIQLEKVRYLMDEFNHYNIKIISDLELINGEAIGEDFYLEKGETPSDMLKRFLAEEERKKNASKHK